MSCNCESEKKQFFGDVKLFTEYAGEIPTGAGMNLELTAVSVCPQCGKAEFIVPTRNMRWVQTAQAA
jgi:hypothetical protein